MNCEKYIILMNMLADGEISSDERKELAEHISSCPECEKRIKQIKLIQEQTAGLTVAPPLNLHDSIMKNIKKAEAQRKSARRKKILSFCAAACIVAVFAVIAAPQFSKLYLFGSSGSAPENSGINDADAPAAGGASSAYSDVDNASMDVFIMDNMEEAVPGEMSAPEEPRAPQTAMPSSTPAGIAGANPDAVLNTNETYSSYNAFFGNMALPDSFGAEDMEYYPQDNEVYIFVKNEELSGALAKIREAGFEPIDYAFPAASDSSGISLIIICGDK